MPRSDAEPHNVADQLAILSAAAQEAETRAAQAEERAKIAVASEAEMRAMVDQMAGNAANDRSVWAEFNHGTSQDPKWLPAYWIHDHVDSLQQDRIRVEKAELLGRYRVVRRQDGTPEPMFFPPPVAPKRIRNHPQAGTVPGIEGDL